jgi:hypothetical protein
MDTVRTGLGVTGARMPGLIKTSQRRSTNSPRLGKARGSCFWALLQPLGIPGPLGDPSASGAASSSTAMGQSSGTDALSTTLQSINHACSMYRQRIHSATAGPGQKHTFSIQHALPWHASATSDRFGLLSSPVTPRLPIEPSHRGPGRTRTTRCSA